MVPLAEPPKRGYVQLLQNPGVILLTENDYIRGVKGLAHPNPGIYKAP